MGMLSREMTIILWPSMLHRGKQEGGGHVWERKVKQVPRLGLPIENDCDTTSNVHTRSTQHSHT